MSSCLIGYSGFIGGNLARQHRFDALFRSTDIDQIRGQAYDLMVVSGVTAVKWWANKNADEDRARIDNLLGHLKTVSAARVVVISTVDVYPDTRGVDEGFDCHAAANHAYGVNRLCFEDEMKKLYPGAMIVRVGGVFGPGLKKNMLYDLLHDKGLETINPESTFQFYNVGGIWADIERMEEQGLKLVNFVTEPIQMKSILDGLFPGKSVGSQPAPTAFYDIRTIHAEAMGGPEHYLATKEQVMEQLEAFVASESAGAAGV
jgi:nucleoside-diphosphate-sugar epimerase